ncbi:MAG: glycosyltransferase family 4 protein [Patescibacteria group bacterium]|nr:glycosyltransferase family 4 protein [Patescibacteria group bacterium]
MRVLLVITKAVVGGAQTSVLNLAREMKRRGHEVVVGFGDGDWLPAELDKEKIPFVRFSRLKRTHNPLASLFFIGEMKNFLDKNKFDAVHFNSSNALPGAVGVKLTDRKIKTVFTFRGMSMLDEHYRSAGILKFAYWLFFKFCLLFIDAPVFVSQENFDKFGQGQLTKKGKMIHNGLDPAKMNFVSRGEAIKFFSQKSGINLAEKYLIGSIGRLDYAKNYEFLIKVFPKILAIRPDAVAVIVGEGEKRELYENLIKEGELKDKIFLIGNVENGARYMRGFDLLAMPSRYEGLPISLIEGLFAELPIIASKVGGNAEVAGIEDEIYALDDEEDFLKKFRALQDIDVLDKILKNNRQQAEKFNLQNTADEYENIYSDQIQ